ncbi:hypothetical protein BvCmsNSNP015_00320 [Escherichia coli]|jgi:hypothetical protein|nr:hypothetical protein ABFCBFJH_00073 [Escherichia coli]GDN00685.1 hypothetical protein BvCmsNSNP015_00320 [Escherichia coli]
MSGNEADISTYVILGILLLTCTSVYCKGLQRVG